MEELDKEFEASAAAFPEVSFTIFHSCEPTKPRLQVVTMLAPQLPPNPVPQVYFPNHSDPSNANPPRHRAPEGGSTSRPGQDLTPVVPHPRSLVNDRTPALQHLPKVQPPAFPHPHSLVNDPTPALQYLPKANTSSSRMSQVSTEDSSSAWKVPTYSRTSQIPSPPSVHQETQPRIQVQKLPDSTSPFSASLEISNSNPASNSPRPDLPLARNYASQVPGDPSPASNSLKEADSPVPVKPASLDSSATTIENDPGQILVSKMCDAVEGNLTSINQSLQNQEAIQGTTGSLSTSNIQPSSSSQVPLPPVPLPQSPAPESAPTRGGPVVIKQPEIPIFDPHFASHTSMQMVGTETKAKKGGLRMWFKGTLENIVKK